MTFLGISLLVLTFTVMLYIVKFTLPALVPDTLTLLETTIGAIVVEGLIEEVLVIDVEVDNVEVVDTEDVVDVEDVDVDVETDVEVVEDVEVDDTEVEGGFIIIPPLPLPPPLPEGATVVVKVVLDVVDVEVLVDVVDVVVDKDMVMTLNCTLLTVTGFDAESVMNTFADIVLPASAVGTSHRKVLLVTVIPVYNAFATRASVTVLNTR